MPTALVRPEIPSSSSLEPRGFKETWSLSSFHVSYAAPNPTLSEFGVCKWIKDWIKAKETCVNCSEVDVEKERNTYIYVK